MAPPDVLLRLDDIARSLKRRPEALGRLALGSVGLQPPRVDAWSDLDFFVLVQPGAKAGFLAALDWLEDAHPLAWSFANTADGYKAVMADGVLCEFAVFEPAELGTVPYAPGRWVWRRERATHGLSDGMAISTRPLPCVRPDEELVGEALSNLLVGLLRFRRGERLAAMRMVQVHAVDRVLEWIDRHESEAADVPRDPFGVERRFEARHPAWVQALSEWTAGIDATPQAALALLDCLAGLAPLPEGVVQRIRFLAEGPEG